MWGRDEKVRRAGLEDGGRAGADANVGNCRWQAPCEGGARAQGGDVKGGRMACVDVMGALTWVREN